MYPSKHDRKRYRYTLKCFNTVKRLSTVRRIFSLWFEISFAIKWQHLPERVWTDRTWNKGRTTDNVRSKTGVVWSHPWMVGHVLCSLLARGREKRVIVTVIMLLIIWGFFNSVFHIKNRRDTYQISHPTIPEESEFSPAGPSAFTRPFRGRPTEQ